MYTWARRYRGICYFGCATYLLSIFLIGTKRYQHAWESSGVRNGIGHYFTSTTGRRTDGLCALQMYMCFHLRVWILEGWCKGNGSDESYFYDKRDGVEGQEVLPASIVKLTLGDIINGYKGCQLYFSSFAFLSDLWSCLFDYHLYLKSLHIFSV